MRAGSGIWHRDRWLTLLLMAGAVCLRMEHRWHYRNLFLDTQVQLAAMQQALTGHGYTTATAHGAGVVYEPVLALFPPGFPVFAWPWFALTGDWIWAAWLAEGVAYLGLALGWGGIMTLLTGTWYSAAARWLWVFWGVSLAPMHYLAAADTLGLMLLSGSLAGMLLYWRTGRAGVGWGSLLLLCLGIWVRSAYVPLLILPGIMAWLRGYFRRERQDWMLGWQMLAALTLPLYGFWLGQQTGTSFMQAPVRGWYPAHLLHTDVFPLKTFLYYGIPHELAAFQRFPALELPVRTLACLVAAGLMVGWVRSWIRQLQDPASVAGGWAILQAGVLGLTLIPLGWLSLTWPPDDWNWIGFWTWVMETRYYAPAMGCLLLSTCHAAGMPGRPGRLARVWLGGILLVAVLGAGYLRVRWYALRDTSGTFAAETPLAALDWITSWHPGAALGTIFIATPADTRLFEISGAARADWDTLYRQDQLETNVTYMVWIPAGADTLTAWLDHHQFRPEYEDGQGKWFCRQ
ncbi:MAG: hypothetical protein SF053_19940 [Bacteroidia bacterium]|nr:hypothetical protein [Bacteroidia bacterium]